MYWIFIIIINSSSSNGAKQMKQLQWDKPNQKVAPTGAKEANNNFCSSNRGEKSK